MEENKDKRVVELVWKNSVRAYKITLGVLLAGELKEWARLFQTAPVRVRVLASSKPLAPG